MRTPNPIQVESIACMAQNCAVCRHELSPKSFGRHKRWIFVSRVRPHCRLRERRGETQPLGWHYFCSKFERLDQLRASNMNIDEKLRACKYTKSFIANVLRWHGRETTNDMLSLTVLSFLIYTYCKRKETIRKKSLCQGSEVPQ